MEAMLKGAQKSFELRNTLVKIGRSKENQCVLDTSEVSWFHAQIRLQGQLYYVVDLNSSNGTYVNEYKLLPNVSHPLSDGDAVRFGNLAFYYITNPSQKMLTKRSPISSNIAHSKKKKTLNWITVAGGLASLATVFVAIWSVFTYLQPASVPISTPTPGPSISHLRSSISAKMTLVIQQDQSNIGGNYTEYYPLAPGGGPISGNTGTDSNGHTYVQFTVQFVAQAGAACGSTCTMDFQGYLYKDGSLRGSYTISDGESGTWAVIG